MTLFTNKFIKVAYPSPNTLKIYQKIKVLGEMISRNNKLWPVVRRIISVTKPSGQISILENPNASQELPKEEEVKILSANLYHDWPRKRRLKARLECFADMVEEHSADILLLQEIARTKDIFVDEWLGERLGMAYVYSRANGNLNNIGFEEGLGVFSRFPISRPRLTQLSDQRNPFVRRIALGASIRTHIGEIIGFSVHLAINNRMNQSQVSRLINWVSEQSEGIPAVIGGDFNAPENSPQMLSTPESWQDSFREVNPFDKGYTHQIELPWGESLRQSRLDYLFLRRGKNQWVIEDARHLKVDDCSISDHRLVLAKARIINDGINAISKITH